MAGFSEEEARRIFARAAERQGAGEAPDDGLSLDELEAIGEASGIAPEHVAAAAAELRAGSEAPMSGGFLLLPAPIRRTRVLPVALSDDAWEGLVEDLRTTFGQTGVTADTGRTREWAVGKLSGRDGVRVTARALDDGRARLDAEFSLETNAQQLRLVMGIFAVLIGVLVVLGTVADKPGSWLFGPLMALFLGLALAVPIWSMRRKARHAERAFGPLLDRAELAARDAAEAPVERRASVAPVEPRVDLPDDDLADASPDPPHRRPRRRSR